MKKSFGYSRLEGALLTGLAAAILLSALGVRTQAAVADKLLRLHVVAASDSEADQAVKLAVRDRVLEETARLTADAADVQAARAAIQAGIPAIRQAAEDVLEEQGSRDGVTVTLGDWDFPTKDYGDFALPAGRYDALRVVIGPGEGRNWWCVLFPPLCTAAAFADTAAAAGLNEEEIRFMTTEDGYEIRFRVAEWIGTLRHLLGI